MLKDYDSIDVLKYDSRVADKDIVNSDENSPFYNVDQVCWGLLNHTTEIAEAQESKKNALVLYGSDFTYENSYLNYW